MKVGDLIVCSNKKIYRLEKGNPPFDFALIDEDGNKVNSLSAKCLDGCLPNAKKQNSLCVSRSEFTMIESTIEY